MLSDKSGARFIDVEYNELFRVPPGEKLRIRWFDGHCKSVPCERIDEYHSVIDNRTWHICEFAEFCRRAGAVVLPANPQPGDTTGFYEIYQIQDSTTCQYRFHAYEEAKPYLASADYHRAYASNLADCVSLDHLKQLHNSDSRSFGLQIRSLNKSDIIVTHRNDGVKAYYVNEDGFQQLSTRMVRGLQKHPNAPQRTSLMRDAR